MIILSDASSILQYRDMSISFQHYPENSVTHLRNENHQLVYVCKGAAVINYGVDSFNLKTGQLVFLKREVAVELNAGSDGVSIISAVISEELLLEFTRMAVLPEIVPAQDPVTIHELQQLDHYFDTVMRYFQMDYPFNPGLVKIKLLELLFCIGETAPGLLKQLLQWKQQVHTDIMAVVRDNLENALPLAKLAKLSGRSLSSFKRDFYAINNMAPSRWIRQKKLEKAREMVANTALSVADVCYTLGFENVTHFSRIFKSYFGYSPSACKKSSKQLKVA